MNWQRGFRNCWKIVQMLKVETVGGKIIMVEDPYRNDDPVGGRFDFCPRCHNIHWLDRLFPSCDYSGRGSKWGNP